MKKVLVVIRDSSDRSMIRQNCGWDNVLTTASAHKAQRIIAENERQRAKLIGKGFREECVIVAEAGNFQLN